jgi:ATP-dependent helicase/nuclease subunit A
MHFTEKVNYNAYLASLQNSEERIKTLNNFINSLYGKNYGNKIVDFINYYENYSEDDELFNNDSDNNGNSINVSTIHKSKGLEFPVVFLIDINHKFNKFDITSNNIFCDNELGISMPYYDEENKIMYPNLISEAMTIKKKQELIEERMRLFYVALTRARNHLFVIGVNEGNFGNKIKDNIQCFMDWLNNISYSNLDFKKTIEIIKINNDLKEKAEEKGEKVLYAHRPADKKAVEEIKKVLNYKYSYLSSTTLPVKFTVTELNEQEDKKQLYTISNDEDENTEDIKIENKTEYDYIERGIIYHKIMQNIDLSLNTYDEVLISVKEMVDNQIISSEEYQKIDIFDVLKCLNSSIIKYASEKKVLREKSFIYSIEANKIIDTNAEDKVLLQGTVDMIILDEKIILIDYKASRKTKDEIIKTYKKQMDLYALVIEGVYKRKVDKKIIYVFNQDLEIEM